MKPRAISPSLPSRTVSLSGILLEPCPGSHDKIVTEELIAEAHKTRKHVKTNNVDSQGPTQSLTCLLSIIYVHYSII